MISLSNQISVYMYITGRPVLGLLSGYFLNKTKSYIKLVLTRMTMWYAIMILKFVFIFPRDYGDINEKFTVSLSMIW